MIGESSDKCLAGIENTRLFSVSWWDTPGIWFSNATQHTSTSAPTIGRRIAATGFRESGRRSTPIDGSDETERKRVNKKAEIIRDGCSSLQTLRPVLPGLLQVHRRGMQLPRQGVRRHMQGVPQRLLSGQRSIAHLPHLHLGRLRDPRRHRTRRPRRRRLIRLRPAHRDWPRSIHRNQRSSDSIRSLPLLHL